MAENVEQHETETQPERSEEVSGKKVKWLNNRCNICTEEDQVSGYCGLCDDFLCTNCEKAHRGSKLTIKHPILKGNDMPEKKLAAGNFCIKHEHEILTEFCNDHNESFCSICIEDSHLQCNRVDVKKLSTDYKTKSEYRSVTEQIEQVQKTIDMIENIDKQKLGCMRTKFDAILENISDFCQTIEQNLHSIKQRAMHIAENKRKNISKEITSSSETCSITRKKIKEISEQLQDLENYGLDYHLVLSTKRAKKDVALIKEELAELTRKNETIIVDYQFKRHGGIEVALSGSTDLGNLITGNNADGSPTGANDSSTESIESASTKATTQYESPASYDPSTVNLRNRSTKSADNADKSETTPPKGTVDVKQKHSTCCVLLCGCGCVLLICCLFTVFLINKWKGELPAADA